MKRVLKVIARLMLYVAGGIALLLLVSALSNLGLPDASQTVSTLDLAEKARIAEYFNLRESLGDEVWIGWGAAHIPVIVHNEAYAFLVGYEGDPPAGWTMIPSEEQRGGPWHITPGDDFFGEPYYRQPLPESGETPENFTVKVGDAWVATIMTREYARIKMAQEMQADFPPLIRSVVPYRLVWKVLLGATETYIGGLCHESFHAFQGMIVPEQFSAAESVHHVGERYPWESESFQSAWQEELDLLARAVKAPSAEQTEALAEEFLDARSRRRGDHQLSGSIIDYERKREWLEGMAKYAELSLQKEAGADPAYQPVSFLEGDGDFSGYQNRDRYWKQQVGEIRRTAGREGDARFYYTGFAQGVVLDKLMPGWKTQLWAEDVWLEELLAEAVR